MSQIQDLRRKINDVGLVSAVKVRVDRQVGLDGAELLDAYCYIRDSKFSVKTIMTSGASVEDIALQNQTLLEFISGIDGMQNADNFGYKAELTGRVGSDRLVSELFLTSKKCLMQDAYVLIKYQFTDDMLNTELDYAKLLFDNAPDYYVVLKAAIALLEEKIAVAASIEDIRGEGIRGSSMKANVEGIDVSEGGFQDEVSGWIKLLDSYRKELDSAIRSGRVKIKYGEGEINRLGVMSKFTGQIEPYGAAVMPTIPTVSVTVSGSDVIIEWSVNKDVDFSKYVIYRDGVKLVDVADRWLLHYKDEGLAVGTYAYKVEVWNTSSTADNDIKSSAEVEAVIS